MVLELIIFQILPGSKRFGFDDRTAIRLRFSQESPGRIPGGSGDCERSANENRKPRRSGRTDPRHHPRRPRRR